MTVRDVYCRTSLRREEHKQAKAAAASYASEQLDVRRRHLLLLYRNYIQKGNINLAVKCNVGTSRSLKQ
jgi:hypothetical protein